MKRLPLMLIIALALLALAWAAATLFSKPPIANLDSRGTTIVAFGDSLVRGVGSTPGNDLVSRLSQRIGEPIVNLGVSGDTTAMALERLDAALAKDPKIVIVLLGGNDYLRRVPAAETFKNLETIVSRIQASGAAVLLLGVRGGLLRDSFDDSFELLAETRQTGFVSNVLGNLIGDKALMSDAVHPNDAGYALIAERVAPVLEDILKRMEDR